MQSLPAPAARKGQTTVEYMLTMLVLLFVFVALYNIFSVAMPKLFKGAARTIVRMYKADPW